MNIVTERRFGTFRVSASLVNKNPEEILLALRECLIIRAEHLWASDHLEYTAFSEYFEPVKEGQMPWPYVILFTRHEDGTITFEFKKDN